MLAKGLAVRELEAGHLVGVQVGRVVSFTTGDPITLHIVREVVTIEAVGVVERSEDAGGQAIDDLVGDTTTCDDTVDILLMDIIKVVSGVGDGLGIGVVVPETGLGVAVTRECGVVGGGAGEDTGVDPILIHKGSHDIHLEDELVIQSLLAGGHTDHIVGVTRVLDHIVTLPDTEGSVEVGLAVARGEGQVVVVLGHEVVHDPIHPVGVVSHVDTCTTELAGVQGPVLAGVENLKLLVRIGDTELAAILDLGTSLTTLLGGDDDNTSGTTGTVLSGLGSVLQNSDFLDVIRRE